MIFRILSLLLFAIVINLQAQIVKPLYHEVYPELLFSEEQIKKSGYQKQILFYNLRLLFILIGLVVGAYYLYNTGVFNTAVNKFLNLFSNKDGLY